MNKEYRNEIKILMRARKQLKRQCQAELKAINREWKALDRRAARVENTQAKACLKIDRRLAVLSGRLS